MLFKFFVPLLLAAAIWYSAPEEPNRLPLQAPGSLYQVQNGTTPGALVIPETMGSRENEPNRTFAAVAGVILASILLALRRR